ncbi:MAG TPA: ABC transporter permease [Pseudonocardiaceae bacterium]|nr:ABC transporter permease [Pseudonocardiaceae bacterium]
MQLLFYLGKRIGQLIPILLGITVVSFVLIRLVPGDPALQLLGNHYTPQAAALVNHNLGLDRSIPAQYWLFLRHSVVGNLGMSYFYHDAVAHEIAVRFPATIFLIAFAGVLTVLIAVPLGTISALRQGGVVDQGARVFFLVGYALPGFLIGVLLILLFGVKIPIFPIQGYGTGFAGHIGHLFLPAITLAIPFSTVLVRSLRATVIEVLGTDYVTTAKLKGLSWFTVLRRDVLPNSLLPLIVVFGVNLAFLVGGTVIIENVFSIPGLGSLLVSSVSTRDFPVVQALTLFFGVFVLAVNLLTDILHVSLDPRLTLKAV